MKMIKPLLIASALVLSSASFALTQKNSDGGYICQDTKAVVNGYKVVLNGMCKVTANGKDCGFHRILKRASDVKTVSVVRGVCKITY